MDDTLSSTAQPAPEHAHSLSTPCMDQLLSLKAIWYGLAQGRLRIIGSWVATGRCFVALQAVNAGVAPCRYPEIAQRVFSGQPPKAVAFELDFSTSTVCTYSKQFLEGCCTRPGAAGLSTFIAKAACAASGATDASARIHGRDHAMNLIVSIDMPLAVLEKAALSRAERDITTRILAGKSRAEISSQRGTSARTLANQLGSIYRKLHVSGRRELMAALLSA